VEGAQEEEEAESDGFQAAERRLAAAARFLAPVPAEAPERPPAAAARPASADARSPEMPDFAAQMDAALKRALDPLAARLTALENTPPRASPAAAPTGSAAPLSSEMNRFMARRPGGMAASKVPLVPQSKAAPRKATVLLEEDFGSEEDELDPRERQYSRREPSYSQRALFRLEGARGRVAQAELDEAYEEDPGEVVNRFERQVMRFANVVPGTTGQHAGAHLLDVWRRTVPAGEHFLSARMGEAVIDAYRRLRAGEVEHALARLALVIGALEQSVRDNGRWTARAETLVGLPPAQLEAYGKLKTKPKDDKSLGQLAQLADPTRSTTATAVHKENAGE